MGQVNVNPGPSRVDESGAGMGMGMIIGLLFGVLLLALVAWWAFTQSGWFGAAGGPAPTTNVNITTNQPASSGPAGNTSGGTGGAGSASSSSSSAGGPAGSTSSGTGR